MAIGDLDGVQRHPVPLTSAANYHQARLVRAFCIALYRGCVAPPLCKPLIYKGKKGCFSLLPFFYLFFYQGRAVDNRVSEAKPEAKQPYLAPQRGENSPHLTHRPHCYAVGERATAARQPNSHSGNIDQDAQKPNPLLSHPLSLRLFYPSNG